MVLLNSECAFVFCVCWIGSREIVQTVKKFNWEVFLFKCDNVILNNKVYLNNCIEFVYFKRGSEQKP